MDTPIQNTDKTRGHSENKLYKNKRKPKMGIRLLIAGKEESIMKEQQIHLRVSPEEYNLIRQKMKLSGCVNMSAYIRKMAIDGMIIKYPLKIPKPNKRVLTVI